jgi:hypothetical protein
MVLVIAGGRQLQVEPSVSRHLSQQVVEHLNARAYLPLAGAIKVKL